MTEYAATLSALLGPLPVPLDYPSAQHTLLHNVLHAFYGPGATPEDYRMEFRRALNAVVYRYCAATESCDAFSESVRRHGDAPPHPERYHQDRAFFDFVINGATVIETFSYAAYAVGAAFWPELFSFSAEPDRRLVSPLSTATAYERAGELAFASLLRTTLESPEFRAWQKYRNVLSHRGMPGRKISLAVGSARQEDIEPSRYDSFAGIDGPAITVESAPVLLRWLAAALSQLMVTLCATAGRRGDA